MEGEAYWSFGSGKGQIGDQEPPQTPGAIRNQSWNWLSFEMFWEERGLLFNNKQIYDKCKSLTKRKKTDPAAKPKVAPKKKKPTNQQLEVLKVAADHKKFWTEKLQQCFNCTFEKAKPGNAFVDFQNSLRWHLKLNSWGVGYKYYRHIKGGQRSCFQRGKFAGWSNWPGALISPRQNGFGRVKNGKKHQKSTGTVKWKAKLGKKHAFYIYHCGIRQWILQILLYNPATNEQDSSGSLNDGESRTMQDNDEFFMSTGR